MLLDNWPAKGYQKLNGEFEKIESSAALIQIDEQPMLVQSDFLNGVRRSRSALDLCC